MIPLGILSKKELSKRPRFSKNMVDFGKVIPWKMGKLHQAFLNFQYRKTPQQEKDFRKFCGRTKTGWDDFALFMTIKNQQELHAWMPGRMRYAFETRSDERVRQLNKDSITEEKFYQYLFFEQWQRMKKYANQKGVQIVAISRSLLVMIAPIPGPIPIFLLR
jgi:4-alpha-glucanotransferase